MSNFLVESYVPKARASELVEMERRVRAAADELSREGTPLQLVRSTYLPDDEVCLHLFVAASPDAVRALTERIGLRFERISEAVEPALTTHRKGE